jgi:hypothetical protein
MDMAEKLLQSDEGILLSRPAYTRQYDYIGSMAEKPVVYRITEEYIFILQHGSLQQMPF